MLYAVWLTNSTAGPAARVVRRHAWPPSTPAGSAAASFPPATAPPAAVCDAAASVGGAASLPPVLWPRRSAAAAAAAAAAARLSRRSSRRSGVGMMRRVARVGTVPSVVALSSDGCRAVSNQAYTGQRLQDRLSTQGMLMSCIIGTEHRSTYPIQTHRRCIWTRQPSQRMYGKCRTTCQHCRWTWARHEVHDRGMSWGFWGTSLAFKAHQGLRRPQARRPRPRWPPRRRSRTPSCPRCPRCRRRPRPAAAVAAPPAPTPRSPPPPLQMEGMPEVRHHMRGMEFTALDYDAATEGPIQILNFFLLPASWEAAKLAAVQCTLC